MTSSEVLSSTFNGEGYNGIVLLRDIEFHSTGLVDPGRVTGTFLGGTITIGDGKGTIQACIEDGFLPSTGNINFNLRCHLTMDDGAKLLMNYAGVIVPDETFWQLLAAGKPAEPGIGIAYWVSEVKFGIDSAKYGWLNDNVFVGHGIHLSGPSESGPGKVAYELYRVSY